MGYLITFLEIHVKFGFPNSPDSPDKWQNSDGGTSNFWISGQSLIKVNFHNFSASDDIEMKLGAVTKLDRRNMPKNFSKNVMSTNDDVILFFASYG